MKTVSKCNRKNPTNTNALKLKKARNELAGIYLKGQTKYIQDKIDKIRDSVEDRQSWMANDKRSQEKEEHCQNESYKPTRTNKTVEIAFPESTRKPIESYT